MVPLYLALMTYAATPVLSRSFFLVQHHSTGYQFINYLKFTKHVGETVAKFDVELFGGLK
jgi:hypothetical protein